MSKNKILVIDDSFMIRKSLVDQLTNERNEVYEAKDGPTGLAMAAQVHPDVILLDFVMPGMDGYEVYQKLREQPEFANTPVIVISSSYDEVVRRFGYPFVGFDFLAKQFTKEQLEERIYAALPMLASSPDHVGVAVTGGTFTPDFTGQWEALEQRLSAILSSLQERFSGLEQQVSALGHAPPPADRTEEILARLQQVVVSGGTNGSEQAILERLAQLESRLADLDLKALTGQGQIILGRLDQLATHSPSATSTGLGTEVADKLDVLTAKLDAFRPAAVDLQPVLQRLSSLETKLTALSTGPATPTSTAGNPWMPAIAAGVAAAVGAALGAAVMASMKTSQMPTPLNPVAVVQPQEAGRPT